VVYPVYPLQAADWQRYWFYVPGIFFMLHFGKKVPEIVRQGSAHGKKEIIYVDRASAQFIRKFEKNQVGSLELTDKMKAMLQEISAIRSKPLPRTVKRVPTASA
jgi:hypothetical protein